jgi:Lon protease-like protein
MYHVGTLAVVRDIVPHPDGRFDLMTNGDARFRVIALAESDAPYLMAEVEWLAEDGDGDDAEAAVLSGAVVRRFDAYRAAVANTGAVEAAQMLALPADPRILSYLVAVAMVLDLSDRQLLLEAATTTDRLRIEAALLARETLIVRELPSLPAVDLARTVSGLN